MRRRRAPGCSVQVGQNSLQAAHAGGRLRCVSAPFQEWRGMDWMKEIGEPWLQTLGWVVGLAAAFAVLTRLMPCNPGMHWWRKLRAAGTDLIYWFIVPLFLRFARLVMLVVGLAVLFGGAEPEFLLVKHLPLWLQGVAILLIQDV